MYLLPEEMRNAMRTPLGPVINGDFSSHVGSGALVTVGDVVTNMALEAGLKPALMIVDGVTKRTEPAAAPKAGADVHRIRVANPAASITTELWAAIAGAFGDGSHTLIEVDGEEDLATLPALVHAPDGATVVYGQPGHGAVLVTVDQTTRTRALELLSCMEVV